MKIPIRSDNEKCVGLIFWKSCLSEYNIFSEPLDNASHSFSSYRFLSWQHCELRLLRQGQAEFEKHTEIGYAGWPQYQISLLMFRAHCKHFSPPNSPALFQRRQITSDDLAVKELDFPRVVTLLIAPGLASPVARGCCLCPARWRTTTW